MTVSRVEDDLKVNTLEVLTSASIPAAGSPGQLQFNGNPFLAADSNLVWDNTNKFLGIGKTPSGPLDVSGTIRGASLVLLPMIDPYAILIPNNTLYGTYLADGTSRVHCIYVDTSNHMHFGLNDEVVTDGTIHMDPSIDGLTFINSKRFTDSSPTGNFLNFTTQATTPLFRVSIAGLLSFYAGIATVSNGVPVEYAKVDLTAQSANISATTLYAVPTSGAGMYRISAYMVETTAGSISSTLPNVQIVFTDNDTGGSITIDATPILGVAGIGQTGALTANTVGTASSGVIVVNAKAGTNIQYQTVNYASNAAGMQYALHIKLEAL
jgi:hypothetical protein